MLGFIVVFASKIIFLLTYITENLGLTFTLLALSASVACYITGLLHKIVHENIMELETNHKGKIPSLFNLYSLAIKGYGMYIVGSKSLTRPYSQIQLSFYTFFTFSHVKSTFTFFDI